jgi:hypothetical protein
VSPADGVDSTTLADLLDGPPPDAIARLGPDAQLTLIALVQQARERQRSALDEAIDQGLAHLPRLLRGSVRLLLFS